MAKIAANGDGALSAGKGASDGTTGATEIAYSYIRHSILSGELPSGATLQEAQLAEQIGVSRTPVREALKRLGAQGLVVLERYRRGYVAHFDGKDFREILTLRSTLEAQAARLAATRIDAAGISTLEDLEDRMEAAYAKSGYDASVRLFDELNTEFHLVIARAAGSTRLVNILENSLEIPASHLTPYAEPHSARIERTFWQHREIIAALKARNAEWASLQMAAHLISLVIVDPH